MLTTRAIQIASNPVLHDRIRHIQTHVHYIRELLADDIIRISYITSKDQIADLLTKAITISRHWFLSSKLMLRGRH